MAINQPIIVSGAHRSGSTWIGKTISEAKGIRYVHEPFNIQMKVHECPFPYWFQHFSEKTPSEEKKQARKYLDPFFNFSWSFAFQKLCNGGSFRKRVRRFKSEWKKKGTRALIKDPIAIMSLPWLVTNYNAKVIISVRHPAAFVASLKVKNWAYDFTNYTAQKDLMETYLSDYKKEIEKALISNPDIIDQGILLWNTLYHTVQQYKQKFPDWYIVTHEALSEQPLEEFRKIFEYLNLTFDKRIEKSIVDSTTAQVASEWSRDASKNIHTWKDRLSNEEIERIKEGTQGVWTKFYKESSWH
ncbi:MAG: hypothetical protein HKN48_06180 [Flavobacteriaceae bacterium]|nr:hypothetical protein [Flavobacteriaceae bacterium]